MNKQKHIDTKEQSKALAISVPGQSFESYVNSIRKIPLLTREQEYQLAVDHYENENLDAARKLVISHLRFVIHIAHSYTGYGLPISDLVQEGNVGLMKAVKRFNPYVGVHLVSFAVHWIRSEIHEYIIRNWRIVKVATTKPQRKLFFNLRSSTKKLGWLNEEETKKIAHDLGVQPSDVREMEGRMSTKESSFDSPLQQSDDDAISLSPENFIEDKRYDPSENLEQEDWKNRTAFILNKAVNNLDDRSRDILKQRWLNEEGKATLHDLAKKYNVSAERIRQLETNAMAMVRQTIQHLDNSIDSLSLA